MKPTAHIIISFVISNVIYLAYHSLELSIISFLTGIFMDIDHVFEYFFQYGFSMNFKDIYYAWLTFRFKKLYLVFHSLELVFVFWFLILFRNFSFFWFAFCVGITQHIVFDIIFNNRFVSVYAYFLGYRINKGFKREYLVRNSFSGHKNAYL